MRLRSIYKLPFYVGLKADESSVNGESDPVKKVSPGEGGDSFMISGSQIIEVRSVYSQIYAINAYVIKGYGQDVGSCSGTSFIQRTFVACITSA